MKAIIVLGALENRAKVQSVGDNADIMRTIYRLIGHHTVQVLPTYPDRIPEGFIVLADENNHRKGQIFNPLASWLFGCDDHGHYITSNAVIVKDISENHEFMTIEEAQQICMDLNARADNVFTLTLAAVARGRKCQ